MAKKSTKQTEATELICEPGKDPKSKKNILLCSLGIGTQSGKHVSEPLRLVLKGQYHQERSTLHKLLDVGGALVLLALVAAIIWLLIPKSTPDLVFVDASVAPSEVITGGSSTLTFRYENKSEETIRNTRLTFDFPEHFLLDAFGADSEQVAQREFALGDIAPTEFGVIHVRGTMFGDVGGEQIFTTTLSYDYGEEENDTKVKEHTFSPTASTLELTLELPDHLVSKQRVEGRIVYTNTGDVDFPDLTIRPNWPESFRLLSSSPAPESDDAFRVRGIESGDSGVIEFEGILGDENDNLFTFAPFFRFGDTSYAQAELVDDIDILPPPLEVTHRVEEAVLDPGGSVTIVFSYENTSNDPVTDVQLRVEGPTAVLGTSGINGGYYQNGYYFVDDIIGEIPAKERGEVQLVIPVKTSLSGGLDSYENILVNTESSATMTFLSDEIFVDSNTVGTTLHIPLTSPFVLSSFARYYASSGDQLGRGPLPPAPNEETKYWIFWNISGTTNDLSNLEIVAPLGPGVRLTGKQSVSIGTAVTQSGNSIVWNVASLEPTMPTNSTVIGAAFEVAITPTEADIDTSPVLIGTATATAQDDFTDGLVSGSSSPVTTLLLADDKGAAYGGTVQP